VAFRYSHFHEVGTPVDASVNCTPSGSNPDVGLPEKRSVTGLSATPTPGNGSDIQCDKPDS